MSKAYRFSTGEKNISVFRKMVSGVLVFVMLGISLCAMGENNTTERSNDTIQIY